MPTHTTDFARLTLLIERVLDAETLTAAQSAPLLQASQASRLAWVTGEVEDTRRHLEQLARHLQTLLGSQALARSEGDALLRLTSRLLSPHTPAGEGR